MRYRKYFKERISWNNLELVGNKKFKECDLPSHTLPTNLELCNALPLYDNDIGAVLDKIILKVSKP